MDYFFATFREPSYERLFVRLYHSCERLGTLFFSNSLKFGEKIANRYRNNTVPPFGPYSLGSLIMAPSKNDVFRAF